MTDHIISLQLDCVVSVYSLLKVVVDWFQVLIKELEMVADKLLAQQWQIIEVLFLIDRDNLVQV